MRFVVSSGRLSVSNYLYIAERTDSTDYDEYDTLLICAPTFAAVHEHINDQLTWSSGRTTYYGFTEKNYTVTMIGKALDSTGLGFIVGSFNAG